MPDDNTAALQKQLNRANVLAGALNSQVQALQGQMQLMQMDIADRDERIAELEAQQGALPEALPSPQAEPEPDPPTRRDGRRNRKTH